MAGWCERRDEDCGEKDRRSNEAAGHEITFRRRKISGEVTHQIHHETFATEIVRQIQISDEIGEAGNANEIGQIADQVEITEIGDADQVADQVTEEICR